MKKMGLLALSLFVSAGFALAQTGEVTSVNIVGYCQVAIAPSGQVVMVGLNFEGLNGASNTLANLMGTNQLIQSNLGAQADRIYIWDPNKAGGPGYYSIFQKPNGNFYSVTAPTIATNPVLFSGNAFWIQSANSASNTHNILLMGAVPLETSISSGFPQNLVMFANPYSVPLDINGTNINWIANGATAKNISAQADQIYVYNGGAYSAYYLKLSDSQWHNVIGNAVATNAIIPVGAGAWYQAKNAFTNSFAIPYSNN
jgi:hypothetical protein